MVDYFKAIGIFIGIGVILIFGYAILVNRLWWLGEKFPKTAPVAHGIAKILYPPNDKTRDKVKMILVWILLLAGILYYNSNTDNPSDGEYRQYDNRGYLDP